MAKRDPPMKAAISVGVDLIIVAVFCGLVVALGTAVIQGIGAGIEWAWQRVKR